MVLLPILLVYGVCSRVLIVCCILVKQAYAHAWNHAYAKPRFLWFVLHMPKLFNSYFSYLYLCNVVYCTGCE